jgi:hypothetical protein
MVGGGFERLDLGIDERHRQLLMWLNKTPVVFEPMGEV